MTMFRKRFLNTSDPSQSIVVADPQSAEVLAELLGRFEPGNWALLEETVIGSMPKRNPSVAKGPLEAAPTASQPALPQAPVMARPSVVSQAVPPPPPGAGQQPKAPEKEKGHERRKQTRFNMEFKVILVCEGKTFRTFSNNVSIGGMLLVHKIPPFMLNNNCRVVIARKDSLENIEFRCRVLGGAENPKRVEFIDCDPEALKSFEAWLAIPSARDVSPQEAA